MAHRNSSRHDRGKAGSKKPGFQFRARPGSPRVPRASGNIAKLAGGVAAAITLVIAAVALISIIKDSIPGNVKAQQTSGLPAKSMETDHARITMVEYADFQCPFCGAFAKQTEAQFIEKYVKTGLVRFEYRHFPFLGAESLWAAHAAECAAEQDRFWDYHDKLFRSQAGENKGAFSRDKLKGFAVDLGLQEKAFNSCMDSGTYLQAIKAEHDEGRRLGVRSTPTFFLNGTKLEGAQPLQVFENAVQNELLKTLTDTNTTNAPLKP